MNKKEPILKFEKEGLVALHFFTERLQFPIAIAAYSEWEEQQIQYLYNCYEQKYMTSQDLCQWCIKHKVRFQIMYPLEKYEMFNNPRKYYEYIKLKRILNRMS